jgi:hypothetical protein
LGYRVEEYKMEGTAVAFGARGGTTLAPDGRWLATPTGEAEYRTRILVVRPKDPACFNGTVILNWQNVSAGVEQWAPVSGEVYRGYAWVGVSAQEVGVYGFPMGLAGRGRGLPQAAALADHDRERYGDLRHPGDQGSFEIFSQAARAVGPERPGGEDPMGGLEVRRVLATGTSQSAMRLVSYINAVQPLQGAIDGFIVSLWEGRAPALDDGTVSFGGRQTTIRGDGSVPVMVVNSEFEALGLLAAGTVDNGAIRVWEVAGAPHASGRDRGAVGDSGWAANPLSIAPVHESAIRQVHTWAVEGRPAPAQPRLAVVGGQPARVDRDQLGNALGGVRLPELQAPTAEYRGLSFGTGRAPLFGASRRFGDDVLRSLYPTREVFLKQWQDAVDQLVISRAILAEDAEVMKARGLETMLSIW